MRKLGIGISIVGGLIALFTSLIFGLIILGLGLVVVSLNKKTEQMGETSENKISVPLKEKRKGYFYWSRTKLGKWSFFVDTLVIIIGVILSFVVLAYLTIDIKEMNAINCGTAYLVTNLFLKPLFSDMSMYNEFCIYL